MPKNFKLAPGSFEIVNPFVIINDMAIKTIIRNSWKLTKKVFFLIRSKRNPWFEINFTCVYLGWVEMLCLFVSAIFIHKNGKEGSKVSIKVAIISPKTSPINPSKSFNVTPSGLQSNNLVNYCYIIPGMKRDQKTL